MGKPITLQLDHINGSNNDHRLENLRFLCPNCHTQTSTYGNKKRKPQKECVDCGSKITKTGIRCIICEGKRRIQDGTLRKVHRPNKEVLWEEIQETPFTTLGNKYGVSDNAIRKWCKAYELPYTKKTIKEYKLTKC